MLFAASLVLAGCSDDDDTTSTAVTTTTTATGAGATTTTLAPVDYRTTGDPQVIGRGFVEDASPDGSAVYVIDQDERFSDIGCEGLPESVLLRLPLGGGPTVPLGTPPPVKGSIVRGKGGRVAVIEQCEGFLTAVFVGREEPTGNVVDLNELEVKRANGEDLSPQSSFAWSSDGTSLLAASTDVIGEGGGAVVRINPATGVATEVFAVGPREQVTQVGQLADGTYVVASAGQVTLRSEDGMTLKGAEGGVFAIPPAGDRVLVGGRRLVVLSPSSQESQILAPNGDRRISTLSVSPDGRAVAYSDFSEAQSNNSIALVTLDDGERMPIEGPGQLGRVVFIGDGKGVVYNRFPPGLDSESAAPVVIVPFR